jgi:hypothetical protein
MLHALEPSLHGPGAAPGAAAVMKRVGGVLLVVGLVDIGVMVWCIVRGLDYASSFNIFAVIAGLLLRRGSLRTAAWVQWYAVFMLAVFTAMLLAWPLVQPLALSLAQLRLATVHSLAAVLLLAGVMALLVWLARQLGGEAMQRAWSGAGQPLRDLRVPALLGAGGVLLLVALLAWWHGGETAQQAVEMAERQLGSGYRFHVSDIDTWPHGDGKSIVATVIAWNAAEVKELVVRWDEQ